MTQFALRVLLAWGVTRALLVLRPFAAGVMADALPRRLPAALTRRIDGRARRHLAPDVLALAVLCDADSQAVWQAQMFRSVLVIGTGGTAAVAIHHAALAPLVMVAAWAWARRSWRRRLARRRTLIAQILPGELEVWATALEATGTVADAFDVWRVSAAAPMSGLLRAVDARVSTGAGIVHAVGRAAALSGVADLSGVAQRLERAASRGRPLAAELQMIAAELRSEQAAEARRRQGGAVPRATLVSAMIVAPACVAVLGAMAVGGGLIGVGSGVS